MYTLKYEAHVSRDPHPAMPPHAPVGPPLDTRLSTHVPAFGGQERGGVTKAYAQLESRPGSAAKHPPHGGCTLHHTLHQCLHILHQCSHPPHTPYTTHLTPETQNVTSQIRLDGARMQKPPGMHTLHLVPGLGFRGWGLGLGSGCFGF